jgi:hypothetical protein
MDGQFITAIPIPAAPGMIARGPRLAKRRFVPGIGKTLALAATLSLASSGCFTGAPFLDDAKSAGPLGTFQLTSAAIGSRTISPGVCLAGDRSFFLGADLEDATAGVVVRLAIDPVDGPAIRVFDRSAVFDKSVVFRRPECRTFHFSDESTMWRINDVQDYKFSLELDCSNKAGDSLVGKASASHCH